MSLRILAVSEKNCYTYLKKDNKEGCRHTCFVKTPYGIENRLLDSEEIYEKMKSSAPSHIREIYENSTKRETEK